MEVSIFFNSIPFRIVSNVKFFFLDVMNRQISNASSQRAALEAAMTNDSDSPPPAPSVASPESQGKFHGKHEQGIKQEKMEIDIKIKPDLEDEMDNNNSSNGSSGGGKNVNNDTNYTKQEKMEVDLNIVKKEGFEAKVTDNDTDCKSSGSKPDVKPIFPCENKDAKQKKCSKYF